jgi:hypothetical protein
MPSSFGLFPETVETMCTLWATAFIQHIYLRYTCKWIYREQETADMHNFSGYFGKIWTIFFKIQNFFLFIFTHAVGRKFGHFVESVQGFFQMYMPWDSEQNARVVSGFWMGSCLQGT